MMSRRLHLVQAPFEQHVDSEVAHLGVPIHCIHIVTRSYMPFAMLKMCTVLCTITVLHVSLLSLSLESMRNLHARQVSSQHSSVISPNFQTHISLLSIFSSPTNRCLSHRSYVTIRTMLVSNMMESRQHEIVWDSPISSCHECHARLELAHATHVPVFEREARVKFS